GPGDRAGAGRRARVRVERPGGQVRLQRRDRPAGRHAMTDLLRRQPELIAAGIALLADAAANQGAQVSRVDWAPPMPGTESDLAVVLADQRRAAANELAVQRMFGVRAHLVDVVQAGPALGLAPGQFLHAGPPISWDRASGPMRGALMGAAVFEGLTTGPEAATD